MKNTDVYEGNGNFWNRLEKKIQSDFICRPQAIELAGDMTGKKIIDVGCGDGYTSRILSNLGADVIGADISPTLIEKAKQTEDNLQQGIEYYIGDATKNMAKYIPKFSQDIAFSICVTPHLKYQQMLDSFINTSKLLKEGGGFILGVPHPDRYIDRAKSNWCHFNYDSFSFKPDIALPITLYSGHGALFNLKAYPHSKEEYFSAIKKSGFEIDKIIEPLATPEDLKVFPDRWGRETELPFYMVFKLKNEKKI